LLVTIVAFTLAFGALAAGGSHDASAEWTGYWKYNPTTHKWTWVWVWHQPGTPWVVS
jgi:hypothetical protein